MRIAIPLVLLALTGPVCAQSPGRPSPSPSPAFTPPGHEAFFRELDALMKKYPESARRFALRDRTVRGPKLTEQGAALVRESICPEGQHCGFFCWTSPATRGCCDCNPLLE
jgi:hypothetical protein